MDEGDGAVGRSVLFFDPGCENRFFRRVNIVSRGEETNAGSRKDVVSGGKAMLVQLK